MLLAQKTETLTVPSTFTSASLLRDVMDPRTSTPETVLRFLPGQSYLLSTTVSRISIGNAVPALVEHGCTATVFVTTEWVQDAGSKSATKRPGRMLSWSQVAEVVSADMEVGGTAVSTSSSTKFRRHSFATNFSRARRG
ncbi:hypothetical protein EAS64_07335 [Trebonia kvetii]|uniref:Uncharacterized protein n=1 Tax=Trebonia kvetii TaxID=2480626 RepID=A0A6P2C738_9ACTN|nr:hypothetical protein EAS64_07335 [Trebonia kvetii]